MSILGIDFLGPFTPASGRGHKYILIAVELGSTTSTNI